MPRLAALLALLALAACAGPPRNMVVLLADEDGQTGRIAVANAAGSVTVDRALATVGLDERGRPPDAAAAVDEAEVRRIFAAALAASPRRPQHFVVNFATDSADLTPAADAELVRVIAAIRAMEAPDIGISGHADRTGSDALNERQSLRRADAVRARLVAAGIASDGIRVRWHGANNPLVPDRPGEPEPRNRRVEVIIR